MSSISLSQIEILGLRAYANNDEYRLPIITRSEQITVEFDVKTSLPPNLNIIFKHASQNWTVDENYFINEPAKTVAINLSYANAPNGVNHYTYRYVNSFPNNKNFVEFSYSGNYIFFIVDHNNSDKVLASGKFILAEEIVTTSMTIENKYHPNYDSPYNQMNNVTVLVSAPNEYTAADMNSIYHQDITRVDLIKNWNLEQPEVIDVNDTNPETFVEKFTMPNKIFWKRDVPSGNEYRRLDLSSTALYPNSKLVVLRDQPDVSRFQWQSKPDVNGASKLKAFTGANSDYLEVEMRLRLQNILQQKIFMVGGFTQWKVLPEFELKQNLENGLFVVRSWLRRGVYDYQYVLGDLDANGNVTNQDWVSLEGNDWRTINRFTALVYYRDRRLGGFDRVIGFVRGRNPGTAESGRKISETNPKPPKATRWPGPVYFNESKK